MNLLMVFQVLSTVVPPNSPEIGGIGGADCNTVLNPVDEIVY